MDNKEHPQREEMDLAWNLLSFIIIMIFFPAYHVCIIVSFSPAKVIQIKVELTDKADPSESNWRRTLQMR